MKKMVDKQRKLQGAYCLDPAGNKKEISYHITLKNNLQRNFCGMSIHVPCITCPELAPEAKRAK